MCHRLVVAAFSLQRDRDVVLADCALPVARYNRPIAEDGRDDDCREPDDPSLAPGILEFEQSARGKQDQQRDERITVAGEYVEHQYARGIGHGQREQSSDFQATSPQGERPEQRKRDENAEMHYRTEYAQYP